MHMGEKFGVRRLSTTLVSASLVLGVLTVGTVATTMSASGATPFKACVVTDTGGINDALTSVVDRRRAPNFSPICIQSLQRIVER